MDLGGRRGMKHMLDYLVAHPEKGLLAYEMGLPTIVQYWRSFEHLEAFAKDKDDPHLEVWRNYWRRVGKSDRTGIWHETYLVQAGQYEAVYGNMPPHGLGKAGRLVPVSAASSAAAGSGCRLASDGGPSEREHPDRHQHHGPGDGEHVGFHFLTKGPTLFRSPRRPAPAAPGAWVCARSRTGGPTGPSA